MTITEIKKYLLKQKPTASFMYIRNQNAYYRASIGIGAVADEILGVYELSSEIIFEIPVNDMGSADFNPTMPAQSLNRWILNTEE